LAASSVLKGSITVDGVSLTITQIGDDFLSVDIIPTTASETTLGTKRPGDSVNLEGDVIGKYVSAAVKKSTLTEDKLRMAGFLD
jgi:riboflavin synthase